MGDGARGTRSHGHFAGFHRPGTASGARRRLDRLISGRHRAAPVRHHVDGYLPGHHRAFDAAVRPAAAAGAVATSNTFGGHDTARKHAGVRSVHHAGSADHTFRQARPGHPVPRCRDSCRLAAVHRSSSDRHHPVRSVLDTLPKNLVSHGMNPTAPLDLGAS